MCFFKANETKQEYENFIHYKAIKPHSSKDIIGLRYLDSQDTVFIHIFNRIDMDTMSCEEFKQKHPLKYEWKKVTVTDMEACDWTLEYP
jgi:hypothetical protein